MLQKMVHVICECVYCTSCSPSIAWKGKEIEYSLDKPHAQHLDIGNKAVI